MHLIPVVSALAMMLQGLNSKAIASVNSVDSVASVDASVDVPAPQLTLRDLEEVDVDALVEAVGIEGMGELFDQLSDSEIEQMEMETFVEDLQAGRQKRNFRFAPVRRGGSSTRRFRPLTKHYRAKPRRGTGVQNMMGWNSNTRSRPSSSNSLLF